MRWRGPTFLKLREGETRTCPRYCFFPRELGTHVYWLTWVDVVEQIRRVDVGGSCSAAYAWKWVVVSLLSDWKEE